MGTAAKVPKVPGATGDRPLPNPNAKKCTGFLRMDKDIFFIIVLTFSREVRFSVENPLIFTQFRGLPQERELEYDFQRLKCS